MKTRLAQAFVVGFAAGGVSIMLVAILMAIVFVHSTLPPS
jgi:hypothetical protein